MSQAESDSVPTPPGRASDRLVRAAVEDSELRNSLLNHALAILSKHSALPPAERRERATEACQETYLRGLQKCDDFDPSLPVAPWLHGILNNVLSETCRAIRRSPVQSDADTWASLQASLEAAASVPQRIDAAHYLAQLPPPDAQLLQLRFVRGLTHEEIAKTLGISVGNARVRLCRALAAAKEIARVREEGRQ